VYTVHWLLIHLGKNVYVLNEYWYGGQTHPFLIHIKLISDNLFLQQTVVSGVFLVDFIYSGEIMITENNLQVVKYNVWFYYRSKNYLNYLLFVSQGFVPVLFVSHIIIILFNIVIHSRWINSQWASIYTWHTTIHHPDR